MYLVRTGDVAINKWIAAYLGEVREHGKTDRADDQYES